jgi:hypothetical protein
MLRKLVSKIITIHGYCKKQVDKKKTLLPFLTLMREGRRGFICYVMKSKAY